MQHFLQVAALCIAPDQRRLTGNGSTLEVLHDDALYKSRTLLYFVILCTINKKVKFVGWNWPSILEPGCVLCNTDWILPVFRQYLTKLRNY